MKYIAKVEQEESLFNKFLELLVNLQNSEYTEEILLKSGERHFIRHYM